MSFWNNKVTILTGGGGFLGSVVKTKLQERGADKIIVPRSKNFDLRNKQDIIDLFHKSSPDYLIHLAAVVGGIGANKKNPGKFFYDNAIMGIELIEQARLFGIKKVLIVGTICSYPSNTPVPFKEDQLWNGYPEETNAPYGIAKKMLLVQSQAYRQQYGMNIIYLLPVNLYGPNDNFDPETSHVIPALIRKFIEAKQNNKKNVVNWGSGNPTREFIYVNDAANGIVSAMENYDETEPVNIGSSEEISIKSLSDKIQTLVGFDGEVIWDTNMPDGQERRKLDTNLAFNKFGFNSSTSLDQGLKETINWYLSKSN